MHALPDARGSGGTAPGDPRRFGRRVGNPGPRSVGIGLAQPRASFGGVDLHASLPAKAAALGFSLTLNHPFLDGNKRVAHAAMEAFVMLNGFEIVAAVDEQERLMLDLAAGLVKREQLTEWLENHLQSAR